MHRSDVSVTSLAAQATGTAEKPGSGLLARLGSWTATHLRVVLLLWLVVIAVFGVFATHVESALAGAGWQDSTSQSVQARDLITKDFHGLGATSLQVVIHDSAGPITGDPHARQVEGRVEALLKADPRVSTVVAPQPGVTLSRDGATAIVQAGAKADSNQMVKAAGDLTPALSRLSSGTVSVNLTGSSAMWSDFNNVNHAAMIRSEVLSWPVTLLVLAIAFGSLVAAGLPLMLTIAGLMTAAGALVISTHIAPVSVWALNFALMFALALGIDYALFMVVRFRAALARQPKTTTARQASVAAVAETMATAGKAVAFSGVTVLVSLSTVLLVPSPAFRSMALGIMLSVVAVLAATLTLLPAVLGRLGTRVNALAVRLPGWRRRSATRSDTQPGAVKHAGAHVPGMRGLERVLHHWGGFLHRRPWLAGGGVIVLLGLLALPLVGLRTGMPSINIIPASQTARVGYQQVTQAFGPGAPGTLQVVAPSASTIAAERALAADHGIAGVIPAGSNAGYTLLQAVPTTGPSTAATGATIDRIRHELPAGTLVGGAAAENHDLQAALSARTPLVFGLLIGLGFLLLLVALGSPLIAFAGVATNLASIGAAFGVARLIFQNGSLSGLLNFQPQGFVDAWGPLFFGAMLSGVAMDYTLFLLSAAREHYDATGDPHHAMRMALRTSGRVVIAAAAVMVAVFLTFALSGPLAPKEMGIILAVAVFLDALCIRMIVLPVVLRLTGHHAWRPPRWLARLLPDVRFSH
jgi:RND superfamily putative drug exporter